MAAALQERLALRILQLGALAVVLASTTLIAFDLDRFFVIKELVLHATAALAGLFALGAIRRSGWTRIDLLLALYLLLSAVSALFATNHWLAARALAISVSGVLLFWTSRALPRERVVNALALAVIVAAVTSLLQAYGLRIDFFASTRVPGGTLGNRNFVAHVAAFGFPLVLLAALRARRYLLGIPLVIAVLVLTRSRGAWLAFGAMALVLAVAFVVSPIVRATWRRLALAVVCAGIGVAAALLLPNALHWRTENPYLQTAKGVTNYQRGSGHGRLIQYAHSLLMTARHPLLGVGPGNWPVAYARFAARDDPSLSDGDPGMTTNPWPSSDWIAFLSERGLAAAVLLGLVLLRLALLRGDPLTTMTLLATLAAAVVAGAFDAVLLLAVPTFLVWAALGALSPIEPEPRPMPLAIVLLVIVMAVAGAVRSAMQLMAMDLYPSHLERAAQLDPGNYRVHLRLGRGGGRHRREHLCAAHALYPTAHAARGCE
jgi:O-antigen ligase